MIELVTDGFILDFKNTDTNRQRNLRIDKKSGRVRVVETDSITNEVIEDFSCTVFDLFNFNDLDKYIKIAKDKEDE